MTDIHSMTNEQLCEAISEAREPKPTYTPKSVEEAWNNRGWFYDLNKKQWECRPWLMWSWAGILLEEIANDGYCPGLIHDDNGHWALSTDGSQNVVVGEEASDIVTNFFVKKERWCDTPQRAIGEEYLSIYQVGME